MQYVITEQTPPGRVLAEVEAENALEALSIFGEQKGYARLDRMDEDELEALGYHSMHGGRFADVSFENYFILASPAGEELN